MIGFVLVSALITLAPKTLLLASEVIKVLSFVVNAAKFLAVFTDEVVTVEAGSFAVT
jgi:hypothetical protein